MLILDKPFGGFFTKEREKGFFSMNIFRKWELRETDEKVSDSRLLDSVLGGSKIGTTKLRSLTLEKSNVIALVRERRVILMLIGGEPANPAI